MTAYLKHVILYLSKYLGLFWLARYLTRKGLRILCYHGFVLADEDRFRHGLFLRPETFRRRMQWLAQHHIPVLDLDRALTLLNQGQLPANATVITVDDGFYSTYRLAFDVLREHSFPATIYVTTYYLVKNHPVFRLAVQYLFWKTPKTELTVTGLAGMNAGQKSLHTPQAKDAVMWDIIQHAESDCDETQREALLGELGIRLAVDYADLVKQRLFHLMTLEEIRTMVKAGIDIQLHTHRHRFPEDEQTLRELADNRAILEPLVGKPLQHFCYPSGVWSEAHWPWLERANVKSATTCDPGLNYADTPRFALHRFLDGENISQLEFEAEICGFNELLRRVRRVNLSHSGGNTRP